MRSILEEFALGNISPDVRFFKQKSEYGRAMKILSDNEEKLRARLNEPEKALLENVVNAQAEINLLTATDKFIYGYRLGVLMMIEVFAGKANLLAGEEGC